MLFICRRNSARSITAEGLINEEFAQPGAPAQVFVLNVCDQAAGEGVPGLAGQPMTAHSGMTDPAALESSDDAKAKALLDTFVTMKQRIELLLALPISSLDAMALHREVKGIGRS